MSRNALSKMTRSEVSNRLSTLDVWAFSVIGVVALGLILESFETVRNWLRPPPTRFAEFVDPLDLVGSLLVTLGVVGEFIVHALHSRATKRFEELSDAEIARLGLEAEQARGEIASANVRAAEAYRIAEEERKKRVEIEAG